MAHRPDPEQRTIIIAHRGASGTCPENTLAAIQRAIEIGSDAVEQDVRRTKDGAIVLMHDATVYRTTDFRQRLGGRGRRSPGRHPSSRVSDLTLPEVKALDAGSWKSPGFAGERVPTLEEALERLRERALGIIEIKDEGIAADVAEVIRKTRMERGVSVISFSDRAIRDARERIPTLRTGLLVSDVVRPSGRLRAREHARRAADAGAGILVALWRLATRPYIDELRARGFPIWVWTVNDPRTMKRLAAAGVDGIATDRPERLREVLRARQRP